MFLKNVLPMLVKLASPKEVSNVNRGLVNSLTPTICIQILLSQKNPPEMPQIIVVILVIADLHGATPLICPFDGMNVMRICVEEQTVCYTYFTYYNYVIDFDYMLISAARFIIIYG